MQSLIPVILNQLASVALGLAGVKLISEFVSADVYGGYGIFLTLTQVGALITYSGLINHGTRYWQRERERSAAYARFLWGSTWRGAGYLAPLLGVLALICSVVQREPLWLLLLPLLLISNVGMALAFIATGVLNADRKPWRVFAFTAASNAARMLIPIAAVLLFGASLLNLSLGFTVHAVAVVALVVVLFPGAKEAAIADPQRNRMWKRELVEYGRPFIFMGIGAWLLQYADRWVAQQFFGDTQAGLFVFASSLAGIIPTMAVGGLMQLVFPGVFRRADQARTPDDWQQIARRCDQATAVFLAVSLLGLIALVWIGPYLTGWLISAKHEYEASLPILLPAGMAMMTAQINQFYYLLLQGQHNSAGMVRVMVTVAGVKTAGSVLAAAISWTAFVNWLVGSVLVAGLIGRFMIRHLALRNGPARIEPVPAKTELL